MRKISYTDCIIYLQPFRLNSLLKCARQPKIEKKLINFVFYGLKVDQGYRR